MELFIYKSETQSVNSFLNDLETSGRIVLDPLYQRNSVWEEKQRAFYINSVIKGIANNNFTFNNITQRKSTDSKDIKIPRKICIDGRQRCATLLMFRQNKIFVVMDDDTLDCKKYYYGPAKKDIPDGGHLLSDAYRCRFLDDTLHFITYQDLTYDQEIDIFNRIQHGKQLTAGELVLSKMKSIEACANLKEFCEINKIKLQHYCNTDRKMDHHFIANLMFMIENDNSKAITKTNVDKFLNTLSVKNLQVALKEIKKIIDTLFTTDLFCSPKVLKSKLSINELLIYCYIIHKEFLASNKIIDYSKLSSAVLETHNSISEKKRTKKSMLDITNTLCDSLCTRGLIEPDSLEDVSDE